MRRYILLVLACVSFSGTARATESATEVTPLSNGGRLEYATVVGSGPQWATAVVNRVFSATGGLVKEVETRYVGDVITSPVFSMSTTVVAPNGTSVRNEAVLGANGPHTRIETKRWTANGVRFTNERVTTPVGAVSVLRVTRKDGTMRTGRMRWIAARR